MKYFKNLSIKYKLLYGFTSLFLILCFVSFFITTAMQKIKDSNLLINFSYTPLDLICVDSRYFTIRAFEGLQEYIYTGNTDTWDDTISHVDNVHGHIEELQIVLSNLDAKGEEDNLKTVANSMENSVRELKDILSAIYIKSSSLRELEQKVIDFSTRTNFYITQSLSLNSKLLAKEPSNQELRRNITRIGEIHNLFTSVQTSLVVAISSHNIDFLAAFEVKFAQAQSIVDVLIANTTDKDSLALYSKLSDDIQKYYALCTELSERWEELNEIMASYEDVSHKLINSTLFIIERERDLRGEALREQTLHIEITYNSLIIILSIALIVSILLSLSFPNLIVAPIKKLVNFANAVSYGNSQETSGIDSKDEIGTLARAIDIMVKKQNSAISDANLAEIRAVEASEHAKEASMAKGLFLARMSHEIRTPMNGIIGMTYLCQQTELTEKQFDYLTKIQNVSEHLLGIINDILDFSKIEANKMELELTDFSLNALVTDLINLTSPLAQNKGLELFIDVDAKIPDPLLGDPLRLNQVLINLVNNAIKFTDSGSITIRISNIKYINSERMELLFEVADTGIGISQESIDNLFDAFSQADGSISRKYGGTGLGLAISKRIVELMDGSMWIESVEGKGSTFKFTIACDITKDTQALNKFEERQQSIMNKKILIAVSNPIELNILKSFMKNLGMSFDFVSTEQNFFDKLTTKPIIKYDCAILYFEPADVTEFVNKTKKILDYDLHQVYLSKANELVKVEDAVKNLENTSILTKPFTSYNLLIHLLDIFGIEVNDKSADAKFKLGYDEDLAGREILLAEDNMINQEIALELLTSIGVKVTIVENGLECLSEIQKKQYELILMDIQMPLMDGLETATKIRELDISWAKDIPIVAMTAHAMSTDRDKSLEVGMQDHITKPIQIEILHKTLRKWLCGDDL